MSGLQILVLIAAVWLLAMGIVHLIVIPLLRRLPGRDAIDGSLWLVSMVFVRSWHRLRVARRDIVPARHDGLIVVANHTGALDPMLLQAASPYIIRWMMASDMIGPKLQWLADREYVIPVDRDGRDSTSLRAAIRYVRGGGAIGVFPEGRITVPPAEVRPFLAGVGVLVSRSRAPVLLAWISGTPNTNKMGESLKTRSDSRVEFVDLIDYGDERDPEVISADLRQRVADVSGWPLNDEVLPTGGQSNGTPAEAGISSTIAP